MPPGTWMRRLDGNGVNDAQNIFFNILPFSSAESIITQKSQKVKNLHILPYKGITAFLRTLSGPYRMLLYNNFPTNSVKISMRPIVRNKARNIRTIAAQVRVQNERYEDLSGDKYCPLHYAAERGNHEVIKVLLKGGANPNVTESGYRHSPLHLLLDSGDWETNEDSFNKALNALLEHQQINVEIHNKDNKTPFSLAKDKGWDYMVQKLSNPSHVQRHFAYELCETIKNDDFYQFKKIIREICDSKDKLTILNSNEDQGITLLQNACANGLTDFVKELVDNGADIAICDKTDGKLCIIYAAEKGYHNILDILIEEMKRIGKLKEGLKQSDKRKETPLHKVVKQEYIKETSDFKACLATLLSTIMAFDDSPTYIDAQDIFGNTPLHYAALQDDQAFVRNLLLSGAHLGIRNEFNTLAIKNIPASVLEDGLNECIKLNNDYKNLNDLRDLEIVLNYRMLVPSPGVQTPETDCIMFLSGSYAHRHLLLHPIISTFLSLKWQSIKKYYIFNLFIYIIFLTILTSYILLFHGVRHNH
ncbi:unnamed protein product, partial [Meganyctiphanes norvegica]